MGDHETPYTIGACNNVNCSMVAKFLVGWAKSKPISAYNGGALSQKARVVPWEVVPI